MNYLSISMFIAEKLASFPHFRKILRNLYGMV